MLARSRGKVRQPLVLERREAVKEELLGEPSSMEQHVLLQGAISHAPVDATTHDVINPLVPVVQMISVRVEGCAVRRVQMIGPSCTNSRARCVEVRQRSGARHNDNTCRKNSRREVKPALLTFLIVFFSNHGVPYGNSSG